ncbi:hypothetical protein [Streptomyces sp. NRRL B-24484]|uniref:hypothetical protein n=1 Tax=Streptomyces sp. NRRL B-24484 TaxID=1463833 RepID=UPI0005B924C3|nr:hypothetical protein [Streptomyces sp. NRRL B-24484]
MSEEPRTGTETPDLVAAATAAGHSISERMLETFRGQGLLPHPTRAGNRGRRPLWLYPPGTDDQLLRLMTWREHSKDPRVLRVVLWLDGFPVTTSAVREAIAAVLHEATADMDRAVAKEAERLGMDPVAERGQALDSIAAHLAAKRKGGIPRLVRITATERADAFASLLRLFTLGESGDVTEEHALTVEKALGVSPGRRQGFGDAGPWLTGPAQDLFGAAEFISVQSLTQAVESTTDDELEAVRTTAAALFQHLPIAARAIAALSGKKNHAGLQGLAAMDEDPKLAVFLTAAALGFLRAGWQQNVSTLVTALERFPDLLTNLASFLDMSQKTMQENLSGEPPKVAQQAETLIQAALDGAFEPAPRPRP